MVLSVHNSVIAFTSETIIQFQLGIENKAEIEVENPITGYMEYSENCNRVLCASDTSLYWLHIKENQIKLTLATAVPIKTSIEQLLNLTISASPSILVLCFSPYGESIAIMINLKQLSVAVAYTFNEVFWPVRQAEVINDVGYVIGGDYTHPQLKRVSYGYKLEPNVGIEGRFDRIFKIGENLVIVSSIGGNRTFAYEISYDNISRHKIKGLMENNYSLFVRKCKEGVMQVTKECFNLIGKREILFDFEANLAEIAQNSSICLFIGSSTHLYYYYKYELCQVLSFNDQILSIDETAGKLRVSINDSLDVREYAIEQDSLVFIKQIQTISNGNETNCLFYYEDPILTAWGNSKSLFVITQERTYEYQVVVKECKLLRDVGRLTFHVFYGVDTLYIFKQSTESSFYQLLTPLSRDLVYIQDQYLLSSHSSLSLGQLTTSLSIKSITIPRTETIAGNNRFLYLAVEGQLSILLPSLAHYGAIKFPNHRPTASVYSKGKYFLGTTYSNYYYIHVLQDFIVKKSVPIKDVPLEFSVWRDYLVVRLPYSVQIFNEHQVLVNEISFEAASDIKKFTEEEQKLIEELKIIEKHQRITGFAIIRTSKTLQEELEQYMSPEFICTTEESIFWCRLTLSHSFTVLSSIHSLDFKPICLAQTRTSVLLSSNDSLYSLGFQKSTSKSILLNKGHVDWRSYKLSLTHLKETPELSKIIVLSNTPVLVCKTGEIVALT